MKGGFHAIKLYNCVLLAWLILKFGLSFVNNDENYQSYTNKFRYTATEIEYKMLIDYDNIIYFYNVYIHSWKKSVIFCHDFFSLEGSF